MDNSPTGPRKLSLVTTEVAINWYIRKWFFDSQIV